MNGTLHRDTRARRSPRPLGGNITNSHGAARWASFAPKPPAIRIEAAGNPYFNQLAFTTPAAGQYGNAGVDTIPGIFTISLNASLNRAWRFGETRRNLQLRLSANNVMNHVQITGFGTTVNTSTYGLPTAASGNTHRHADAEVQFLMRHTAI